MWFLKQLFNRVPKWAFLLVLLVGIVNTIYLVNMSNLVLEDTGFAIENGECIVTSVKHGGEAEKAGLQTGDIVLSINSVAITGLDDIGFLNNKSKCSDTLTYVVARDDLKVSVPLIHQSLLSMRPVFFHMMYGLILLLSFASLYILFKKPNDLSVRVFFIYIQLYAMAQNAYFINYPEVFGNFASVFFMFSISFYGLTLIHFHLLFPQKALIYMRFRRIPVIFYGIGFLVFVINAIYFFILCYRPSPEIFLKFLIVNKYLFLWWITLTFIGALAVVIYQYVNIKSTLARNQLRIIIIGSFFGFAPPMFSVFFYDFYYNKLIVDYPMFSNYSQWTGSLIMIACFLVALFQYRIWDTEIFIRKALLYLFASLIIILSYFLMIYLVDQFTSSENNLSHFLILLVSVIIFLVLRDFIQRLINRFFHREAYDSTTVVTDFEEKLSGIYQPELLIQSISQGLDEIFHFKSFLFSLRTTKLSYEPAFISGMDFNKIDQGFEVSREFEEKLGSVKIFSLAELNTNLPVFEQLNGELVVPLVADKIPSGFLVCGQKKSERMYSLQDIRVLSLLAKRIVALFDTAALFQKDLERQVMLERERARISQDMHDDVGASLTRISILSDLAKNKTDLTGDTKQWLGQISDTSRGVMEEMNQIIWALNPKNDTLEGLVAYLRRFVYEYLEPTTVNLTFDLPENLPEKALSVEVRRNVYLVVREAMHNVVKHAVATKVFISMRMNQHGFRMMIRDDGKGFDHGIHEFPGNGLINMKKRMNDIEGEFLIKSKTGEGTVIELVVPLK